MSAEERVYRTLLSLYPREFRDEYGTQMQALFKERRSSENPIVLWLHVLADVGITAPRERMDTLLKDFSYAARTFLKNPVFTITVVAALALGIGVNSAMFSIIDAVLLRNLPFKNPQELAMIWQPVPKFKLATPYVAATPADFSDWKRQNRSFTQMAAFTSQRANLSASGLASSVAETLITDGFFSVLGTPPYLGTLTADTGRDNRIAVLDYRFWRSRFNGDPAIIGRNIHLDTENFTVIGVMPEQFRFPEGNAMPSLYGFPPQTDVWIPAGYGAAKWHDRNNHTLLVIGRLKPGVSIHRAQTDLASVQARLRRLYPEDDRNFDMLVTSLRQVTVGSFQMQIWLLFAAVGFVLLIACANVANLLLARATVRRREIALRIALGAPRTRLYRQLLTESVLLSLLGAIGGILLARALLPLMLAFAPATIPRLAETRLDWRVVVFTLVVSVVTGVLFGLVPAVQLVNGSFTQALQESAGKGQVGVGGSRLRRYLVVIEVALAVVLLVGAGLALRSLLAVEATPAGFHAGNAVTLRIALPASKYKEATARRSFFEQLLSGVTPLPGIGNAGLVSSLPLSSDENLGSLLVKGQTAPGETVTAERRWASAGYFHALTVPFKVGRDFAAPDGNPGGHVAIVNEAVSRRFFPNRSALGEQVSIGHGWLTVVGVIGDIRNASLESSPLLQVYLYYAPSTPQAMTLVVQTPLPAPRIATAIQHAIAQIDPDQSFSDVKTMDQVVNGSIAARRFGTIVILIFGILALLLTIVGLYSVVAYNVALRSREFGLRIALGALRGNILALILRDALAMTGFGLLIGIAAALAASHLARTFVYGVPIIDSLTFFAIALLLLVVTALAAYLAGRRAASLDPNIVLREE